MFDTDIISFLIRGSSLSLKNRFESENSDNFSLSVLVYAEILFGLKKSGNEQITNKVKTFIDNLRIVDFSVEAAEVYSKIRIHLEKSGRPTGNMDLLIAASAITEGAVLVTHNTRHFQNIPDLKIEDWL